MADLAKPESIQPTPMIITAAGLRVLAQGQIGLPIAITRVSVGDGYLPPETAVEKMTELINEVRDMPVNGKKVIGDGTVKINTIVSNKGVKIPYLLREVGVWAVDNDTGEEVLYSYANYGDAPIFIPADMGYHAVNIDLNMFVIIGRAEIVSVTVTEGYGWAKQEDVDAALAALYGKPAPITHFWTADEKEPNKLRPATDEDVIAHIFARTTAESSGEPVFVLFNPVDKSIYGVPVSRLIPPEETPSAAYLGASWLGAKNYLTPQPEAPNVAPATLQTRDSGEQAGTLDLVDMAIELDTNTNNLEGSEDGSTE